MHSYDIDTVLVFEHHTEKVSQEEKGDNKPT